MMGDGLGNVGLGSMAWWGGGGWGGWGFVADVCGTVCMSCLLVVFFCLLVAFSFSFLGGGERGEFGCGGFSYGQVG